MRSLALALVLALTLLSPLSSPALASLDIGSSNAGLSIGNSPEWKGVRLNFADRGIDRIQGLNLTVWRANGDGPGEGRIDGIGLGIWGPKAGHLRGLHVGLAEVVGAHEVTGIGISLIGVGAGTSSIFGGHDYGRGEMRGVFIGGLGLGAASNIAGIAIGGLGMGVGNDIRGIAIGGLGMGVGNDVRGIVIGGLGAGVGGHARGVVAGLLGAGVGESFKGIGFAGIGMGVGEEAAGLFVSGIGQGVGGDFAGISVAGIGTGVGGDFRGISINGIGLGVGGRLDGIGIGGIGVGARDTRAITAALLMTRGESMQGLTIGACNKWDSRMEGLALGLLNITDELRGVQLGLLNIAYSNPGWRRIFPIINWGGN